MQLFSRPAAYREPFAKSVQDEIITLIRRSEKSLKIAVAWFTNREIFSAILDKLSNPEYSVELIVLNDKINNKNEGVNFQKLIELGRNFYFSDLDSMVHHKFCIIDDTTLVTGSYNWTYYGENRNWENVLILTDPLIVKAFAGEFQSILHNHKKVSNVESERKIDVASGPDDYLEMDYLFQANSETEKGNDLTAAKIFIELSRLNNEQGKYLTARNEILKKYNSDGFTVSPFEIGILYQSGYEMAIPAFTPLPLRPAVIKNGATVLERQIEVHVTIQKYDVVKKTILELDLLNIEASARGTAKVRYILNLDTHGTLTVECVEIGGFGRKVIGTTNVKSWL